MKKLRETKNESCTVDGKPGQTYSETTGKESFTEPMPAVKTTPVDFARVTLANPKLHPDPGTTPALSGPPRFLKGDLLQDVRGNLRVCEMDISIS